jgi:hypothetical protein
MVDIKHSIGQASSLAHHRDGAVTHRNHLWGRQPWGQTGRVGGGGGRWGHSRYGGMK